MCFLVSVDAAGRWKRIDEKLYDIACDPTAPNLVPSKLRPLRDPGDGEECVIPKRLGGNFILHLEKTETHFNDHIRQHLRNFPFCDGNIVFDPEAYQKWGAAISCGFKCTATCGYRSPRLNFFETVDVVDNGAAKSVGRKAAKLNLQIQVALSKQPISNEGLRHIFLACDINAPCQSSMQRLGNKVMDSYITVNTEKLKGNRRLVNDIMKLRHGKKVQIVTQMDTAFNNPAKGRAFYQPATQAWAHMFCAEPGLERVPLAFQTGSKLCSCTYNNHLHDCKRNFPFEEPMGNVEYKFGKGCAEELTSGSDDTSTINVQELVTDGDSHAFKGLNEVMPESINGSCTFHLSKSISRNIMKCQVTSCDGRTVKESLQNKRSLSKFIQKRCTWEFRKAYTMYGNQINRLQNVCKDIKKGIIGYVKGDVEICKRFSLVCSAHKTKSEAKVSAVLRKQKYK
jgi:hypothetical protein